MKSSKNSTKRKITQTQNSLLNRRLVLMAIIDGAGGAALIPRTAV
jgi:hypothetical protein